MNIVIIGAGNGGLSLAGDLKLSGHRVTAIYDRFEQALEPVRRRGGIELVGPVRSGFVDIPIVTSDIGTAIEGGDVFLVSVPAFGHAWIAEAMAPHMRRGMTIVVGPAYFAGSVLFRRALERAGTSQGVRIVELNSLPYATRIVGPAQVGIKAVKRQMLAAALPHSDSEEAIAAIGHLFPPLLLADTVLSIGLVNQNPISHVPTYLLNLGRVHDAPSDANFDWHDWVTDDVHRVQSALDVEIQALGAALGVRTNTRAEMQDLQYRGIKWEIIQPTGAVPANAVTVPDRFITEDVPEGLVPLSSLGTMLGVSTPVMDALIELSCVFTGTDFRRGGRTLSSLGLPTTGAEALLAAVR